MSRRLAALAFSSLLLIALPVLAQDLDLGTSGAEEPPPDEEKPYDPTQAISSTNDPGTAELPQWEDNLFDALPLDPSLIDAIELPAGVSAPEPSETPFPAAAGCGSFTGTVTPLQLWSRNPRYFSFQGKVRVLVGVSADNSCALVKPPGATVTAEQCTHNTQQRTDCRADTYDAILTDAAARGLNRTRLWVVLPSEPPPTSSQGQQDNNHIFEWDHARRIYRLDRPNTDYLARLRNVVDRAKQLNMFVEVTFYSPGSSIGKPPDFQAGPWGGEGRYTNPRGLVGTNITLLAESFPAQGDFVRATANESNEDPQRKRMQEFQRNVVDWVVDALWCYDNVWWEVANEPEGLIGKVLNAQGQSTGFPTPAEIADWQKRVIDWIRAAEARHATQLIAGHPIAVNPFTAAGTASLINHPHVSVVEGHYTSLDAPTPIAGIRLNSGTNQLLRDRRSVTNRVLGSNEDKITPAANLTKNTVHEAHRNTVIPDQATWGAVEAARAGAWEAMFHQAGTVDHFGYCYTSPEARAIRDQLGRLRTFMVSIPLANLRPAPGPAETPPRWLPEPQLNSTPPLPGLTDYPVDDADWEAATGSRKYWAALETADTATGRAFAAYFHHSAPRCKGIKQDYQPTNRCNNQFVAFQGYDARVKASGFRERLRLSLGASAGTFRVEWIDPASLVTKCTQTVTWNPNGTCTGLSCSGANLSGTCIVESPSYDFDLTLKITQQ